MPLLTVVLLRGVVRALALVTFYALVLGGGASTEAIGIGLLGLPVMALFALVVAGYDGWHAGLLRASGTWVLGALLVGLGVPVWDRLREASSSLATGLREDTVVFGLLTLVPALVGAAAGATVAWVVRRSRPVGPAGPGRGGV